LYEAAVIRKFVVENLLLGAVDLLKRGVQFFFDRGMGLAINQSGAKFFRVSGDIKKVLPSGGIRLRVDNLIERCGKRLCRQVSLLFNRSKMILVSAVPLWRIGC